MSKTKAGIGSKPATPSTVLVDAAQKRKPPSAGIGRTKGVPNKITTEIKDMLLGALEDNGGQQYLSRQAQANPVAFMGLLGKIIPRDIKVEAQVDMKVAASQAVAAMMAKLFKPPGAAS